MTKWFGRWASKEGLTNQILLKSVFEIEQGLIDAFLGNHLVIKRIGVCGQGKSKSLRTIVAVKVKHRAFFIYGFAKNKIDNIDEKELRALKLMASNMLAYDCAEIEQAIRTDELIEVKHEEA